MRSGRLSNNDNKQTTVYCELSDSWLTECARRPSLRSINSLYLVSVCFKGLRSDLQVYINYVCTAVSQNNHAYVI